MRYITDGYRGMSVLINVNCDRLLFPGAIAVALFAAAYVASL
ncbi:hypothetical protein [Roseovarius dicentrarchi]|nr:hypothetical protein [Roseovarius dicentrarchi]